MELDKAAMPKNMSKDLTELMIRIGLIAFLVVVSVQIFSPFMGVMLWALVLAVTLYPLHQSIARRLGNRQGRAATLLVLLGVLLIVFPTFMLGSSLAGFIHDTHMAYENNAIKIEQPPAGIAEWPIIGPKLHEVWSEAVTDLPGLLQSLRPQLKSFSETALAFVAGTAAGVLQFLASLVIAGIMMAYGQAGSNAMLKIIRRFSGNKEGEKFYRLSTATIRSVSMGVLGVAFIQALLLGVGFVWAGVPAAGLLAIVVLVFGIAQLPALIVSLPVIAYIWWSGDSTMSNVAFTVYLLVAGMADNVLKPLLLGRGVDAPMPIVLLGALGGMVSAGLIGLFLGAVLLSLGYVIFMDWVAEGETEDNDQAADAEGQAAPAGE